MNRYYIERILYISVSQLRAMHQSIVMNTYIHKSTELGYVGHYARHLHPLLHIIN